MRIIALLFAFVLAGCTGNRLNAETKPVAVALCAPPITAVRRYRDGSYDLSPRRGLALPLIADHRRRDAPTDVELHSSSVFSGDGLA